MDELHDRLRMTAGKVSFRQIGSMTGTHPETVRRYMQGQAPSVAFVIRFAEAFEVGLEWLLTGRGLMRPGAGQGPALQSVGLDTLLKAVGDRLTEIEHQNLGVREPKPVSTMEAKHTAEPVPAAETPMYRSARPLEDIRKCLAERRRSAEAPAGDHYDAA